MSNTTLNINWKKTILFLSVLMFVGFTFSSVRKIPAASTNQKVHTIYWKATLRRDVKVGKKTIKRGTAVTVIQRGYHSYTKSVVKYKDLIFKLSNSSLSYKCDLASVVSKGDYSTATKEAFVNRKSKASSKTPWFIWVSLDKQRVNVFKGSKGNWKLVKVFRCSTGKASTPTPAGWNTIDLKKLYVSGCKYYTEVCGSGMHRWPGKLNEKLMGRHTASHSCIRLYESSAKWIYEHIPKKTKVYIY